MSGRTSLGWPRDEELLRAVPDISPEPEVAIGGAFSFGGEIFVAALSKKIASICGITAGSSTSAIAATRHMSNPEMFRQLHPLRLIV